MIYKFSNKTILAITLLLATFLYILGIWHGYPYSFYPDEAHFVKRALSFGSGDLNPYWFHKPAFFMYILFAEYGVFFVFGKMMGLWSTTQEFAVSFVVNPGPFYLIGRLTVAAFSVGSIFIIYLIGERHFKARTGLLAAILFTFTVGVISASQDVKADIPAMFFNFCAVFFLMEYVEHKKLKYIIYSCIFAGVATGTKYYGYVMLVPIYLSIFLIEIYRARDIINFKKLVIVGLGPVLIFYLAFFICSPFNFLDPLGRIGTFGRIYDVYNTMLSLLGVVDVRVMPEFLQFKPGRLESIIDYYHVLVSERGMGLFIGLLSIVGLIILLASFRVKMYLFLLFPLIFIFVSTIVYPGYSQVRHQIPIYPFLVLGAANLIVILMSKFDRRIVFSVLALLLIFPMYTAMQRGIHVSKQDTRNLSKAWIEENIPLGTKLILDEYGPVLFRGVEQLLTVKNKAENARKDGQFTAHYSKYIDLQLKAAQQVNTYDIQEIRFPWWKASEDDHDPKYDEDMANPLKSVEIKSLQSYYDEGYGVVVLSSERYSPFFNSDTTRYKNFPSFRNFYHEVFEKGKLIKEFNPEEDDRPGPTIKIFKLEPEL